MTQRLKPIAAVVLACWFPSIAAASDFGGLAVGGLVILALMSIFALVLAALTPILLNRFARTRVNWWWLFIVFVPMWFYILFNAYRLLFFS